MTRLSARCCLLASVAGLSVLGAASGAAAQASDQTSEVDEVIVTALRRGTTVQNTAASLQAITSERLEELNINNTTVLQQQVPGLIVGVNSGMQTQAYIRGVGNNITGIAASNSVATYVDGVYIPNAIQAAQPFSDTERVEVLKGPQATLYGRNATGGAINIITKEPTLTPSFSADVMVGNYKAYSVQTSINGPLFGDKVAGRLSLMAQEREGYATNVYLGNHPGGDQQVGARGQLKFFVTENLDVLLRADFRNIRTGDYVKGAGREGFIYLTSTIPNQFIDDPWKIRGEMNSFQPGEDGGASLQVKWNTGLGEITSITSQRRFFTGPAYADFDTIVGTYNGSSRSELAGEKTTSNQFFHETYLSTPEDNRLQAIVGANYFFNDSIAEVRRISTGTTIGSARRILSNTAWAAFVDLGFDLTPEWRIVGGVRYSHEEADYSQLVRVTVQSVPPGFSENTRTWNATSPRLGVEWRPAQGRLFYFTATSGFKAGGFNESAPLNAFNPEKIWSYEGGAKTTWADGRLRINGSAFYYDYRDLQVSLSVPVTLQRLVANAESADIYGLDLEVIGDITDRLSAGASLALLRSKYGNLVLCDNVVGPCSTPPNDQGFVNVSGNTLIDAPETAFSTYIDYDFTVGDLPGEFQFHADGAYRSRVYWTPFEREEWQSAPPTWMFNAQLRYQSDSYWHAAAFVQNIFDEDLMIFGIASGVLRSPASSQTAIGKSSLYARYAPPRLIGVKFGVDF